jgi:hypothetical protein
MSDPDGINGRAEARGGSADNHSEIRMPLSVDGFLLPVPKRKLEAYRRMAQKAGRIWRQHGAVELGNARATASR